jgi:pimeloyl-ACP methyl ester carboxylesterase
MWLLALIFILCIIIIFIALIYLITYQYLMNPNNEIEEEPQESFKNLFIPINSVSGIGYTNENKPSQSCINVWHFDEFAPDEDIRRNTHKTMLFFHGNSFNISKYKYIIEVCKFQRLNLLLVDYRGYGRSGGMPSLAGICKDGHSAYCYLAKNCKPENIIIWGESMGGAPAISTASKYPCGNLVLLGTFSGLDDLIIHQKTSSWMTRGLGMIVPYIMNSLPNKKWIKHIKCRILIVHSEEDDLVPYECARINHKSARFAKMKKLITIKGGHKTPKMELEQLKKIFKFIGLNGESCTKQMLDNLLANIHCITSTI